MLCPRQSEHTTVKYCGQTDHASHQKTVTNTILMSSNLVLPAPQLVEYYGLCFQIEFNFRDAKPHLGLEDFMNITPTVVNNVANLAMCMVNVSTKLIVDSDGAIDWVRDLKTAMCGQIYRYGIKILPPAVQNVLKIPLERTFLAQGSINATRSLNWLRYWLR